MNLIFTLVTALSEFDRPSEQPTNTLTNDRLRRRGGDRRAVARRGLAVGRRTDGRLEISQEAKKRGPPAKNADIFHRANLKPLLPEKCAQRKKISAIVRQTALMPNKTAHCTGIG